MNTKVWTIPVTIKVTAATEQQARSNVSDLLGQGIGFCSVPGSIDSYDVGKGTAQRTK